MPTIDPYSYFNGICEVIYFLTCLLCGLHLCLGFPFQRHSGNRILSQLVGTILLCLSCSAVCYILSAAFPFLIWLYYLGTTIDLILFTGVSCVGYVVYSNNRPSAKILLMLALPFVAIALVYALVPSFRKHSIDYALIVLIIYYLCYGVVLLRREKYLDDLYSNQYLHSLRWIIGIVILMIGWWALRITLLKLGLDEWYDMSIYSYMSGFVLFVFYKISNYGEPVSIDTQKDIEQVASSDVRMAPDSSMELQKALITLLEEQKVYLDPDLKVDDVVRMLGTNAKYFSIMLHNDMNTSFCELINTYRVEESKKLLKCSDDKLVKIAQMCGYHSADTFCRNFFKIIGKTPTEWRIQ